MISFPWENSELKIPLTAKTIRVLEPSYPAPLNFKQLEQIIRRGLNSIENQIRHAKKIALIVEDCTRITVLADFLAILLSQIQQYKKNSATITLVIAAGAHYNLAADGLRKKLGVLPIPYYIHDAIRQSELMLIGTSSAGIPLYFNKRVSDADFRLTISTLNIHPLAGFSGGAKILLPGVAGLETITAFHGLPRGNPGIYQNPMQALMNEVLAFLPVDYSWQLFSGFEGKICKVFGGDISLAQKQGIEELKNIVTVANPQPPADLTLAGASPFHQNLLGSFKALPQLVNLVRPDGTVVLLNEALQGTGGHHWRMKPDIVAEQKNYYQNLFQYKTVALYSPSAVEADFRYLFPPGFILLKEFSKLTAFINNPAFETIAVLPHAPLTLIKH
jgi:Uncharacterized conserved protein